MNGSFFVVVSNMVVGSANGGGGIAKHFWEQTGKLAFR
jgi:hypothetical protein